MSFLPTITQLRHLTALFESQHFSRAAARCYVTQSTLSASIKDLEEGLGARLVERDKRNVAFTDIGIDIVNRAHETLACVSDLVAACDASKTPFSGRIRLSAIPTIAPFIFPKLLAQLRRRYAAAQCYLREEQTHVVLENVRAGHADIGIIALPFEIPASLETRTFAKDDFFCVHHSKARSPVPPLAISAERLQAETLLLLEDGHCLRDHAITACKLGAEAQTRAVSATSLSTLIEMVDSGIGSTILPALAINGGLLKGRKLVAHKITPRPPSRSLALVFRKTSTRKIEIDFLHAQLASLVAQ